MSKLVKFAHLADLHLGGWREKKLTNLNFLTFQKTIDKVIESNVEFCLFAGDIFNNAMPPLELVQKVAKELLRLKENNIPLYVIGGSHDYSHTGKSFLELLEITGIFKDVAKWETIDKDKIELIFTKEKDTNLSGVLGKRNGLDKNIYTNLNSQTLSKDTFNIFMFHTTLNDIKPDFMKAVQTPVTSKLLPNGFDYYAGGHVHTHIEREFNSGMLSYPGPLFPNNFTELIREKPSFNICTFNFDTRKTNIERVFLETYSKTHLLFECENQTPLQIHSSIVEKLNKEDIKDKIVLFELKGVVEGKISDIKLQEIVKFCYEKGAEHVLKNTYKLTPSVLKEVEIKEYETVDQLEKQIIEKSLDESKEKEILKSLLGLELQKIDGEKVLQHEQRIKDALDKVLNK